MIEKDLSERLIAGVRSAKYSLLVGAGFSRVATSADGRPLPIGQELSNELARQFSMPENHPLARLWGALPTPQRENALASRFKGCIVASHEIPVHRLVWRTIYSFNVDDVVEKLYASPDAKQALVSTGHREPYATNESIAEVRCVHLHGSVLHPSGGYVFSTSEYGRSTVNHTAWGPAFADELAASPFIVLGCSLDEYDIEHHLARRGGIEPSRETLPSLFVSPNADSVVQAAAARFGLAYVNATASDFVKWLVQACEPIPTPTELLVPTASSDLYSPSPSARDLRIFHRQFLWVREDELPTDREHDNFLRGLEPAWSDLRAKRDILRHDVNRIVARVRTLVESKAAVPPLLVLDSAPGGGKTTVLMRAALTLEETGIKSFYFSGRERLSTIAAAECLERIKGPAALLIMERLGGRNLQVAIVGADRENRSSRLRSRLAGLGPEQVRLQELSLGEATDLVRKMRSEGLLGLKGKRPDSALVALARGRDLLVAMCELSGGERRFDEIVRSVWNSVSTPGLRRVLALVALGHSLGYPVKTAVVQGASEEPIRSIFSAIGSGELEGILYRTGYAGEYLNTQHRVIASRIVRAVVPEGELFDCFVMLARKLAPYVSRKTIIARTVEARLAGRLLDFDPNVSETLGKRSREFYANIKDAWEWNSRYWEQLALLELQEGNLSVAVSHAEQAIGVEEHPLTYTTYAKVLMRAAEHAPGERDGFLYLAEARHAVNHAIALRHRTSLRDEHAHHVGIDGAIRFFQRHRLSPDNHWRDWVDTLLAEADSQFPRLLVWAALRQRWTALCV
ncbi:MAG: SIR2 family protein [Myxococcales bacterium]|nr:SIR2 family protein [Myxococcales bacterium]